MNERPRQPAATLVRDQVPTDPGVYAWYRNGEAVYVGRALGQEGIRGRVWKNHLRSGPDLARSSFRRNVCEHLGIAPSIVTRLRPTQLSRDDVAPVNAWVRTCDVAWIVCKSASDARGLEDDLKREWLPSLSRQ